MKKFKNILRKLLFLISIKITKKYLPKKQNYYWKKECLFNLYIDQHLRK